MVLLGGPKEDGIQEKAEKERAREAERSSNVAHERTCC
jgi:hypothetical protein